MDEKTRRNVLALNQFTRASLRLPEWYPVSRGGGKNEKNVNSI